MEDREYAFLHFPAEDVQVDPSTWLKVPPAAKRVFEVVRDDGPLTNAEIAEASKLAPRTVRSAVKALKEEGLLDERCSLRDCRTCYFFIDRRCVGL